MTVTGWRLWDLDGSGSLRSPMVRTKWTASPVHATCGHGNGHPAPDPRCQCGIRAAARLEDLILWICIDVDGKPKNIWRFRERPPFFYPPYVPQAVSQVTLSGRILGPADDYDRPGTLRAEHATVKGPLYFGQPFGQLAAAAANRYGTDVVVSDLEQPDWMHRAFTDGGGLAADVKLYEDDPAQLGPRLYRAPRRVTSGVQTPVTRTPPG